MECRSATSRSRNSREVRTLPSPSPYFRLLTFLPLLTVPEASDRAGSPNVGVLPPYPSTSITRLPSAWTSEATERTHRPPSYWVHARRRSGKAIQSFALGRLPGSRMRPDLGAGRNNDRIDEPEPLMIHSGRAAGAILSLSPYPCSIDTVSRPSLHRRAR